MIMLAGAICIAQTPSPGAAQSAADLAKSMQDQWKRCLRHSYETYERRTPSKNSAAELAFQFCATQEETLWIYSSEFGRFAERLRAAEGCCEKGSHRREVSA